MVDLTAAVRLVHSSDWKLDLKLSEMILDLHCWSLGQIGGCWT
jgi:hypothetical protein